MALLFGACITSIDQVLLASFYPIEAAVTSLI